MKTLITKITFIAILLLNVIGAHAQQFTLSGEITGEPTAYIFLRYINSDGETIKDSCSLQNGKFSFKGNISEPTRAYFAAFIGRLRIRDDSDPNSGVIFLEPGYITANGKYGHLHELDVKGSKTNDEFLANTHPLQLNSSNSNSYIAAYHLNNYKPRLPLDSVERLYNNFTSTIKNSRYGKEIEDYILKMEDNWVGKTAKNFNSVEINGKKISLSDFKGKYVLLDFWGSWCVPCRKGVPHIKDLYAKYHKAGLDILAIAVDDKPRNWKEAIKKDGTGIWHNILDLATTDKTNGINAVYNVHVFPTKILVGKNGVIIGRYDGSETTDALDKKLAEIFKDKD